jgi:predicted nucleic acid-binding protein
MKKSSYSLLAIAFMATMFFVACHPSKKIENATGAKEIIVPFSGKEYQSDNKFSRAKNTGNSFELDIAKKMAVMNAKTELSSNINSTMKKLMESYFNQYKTSDESTKTIEEKRKIEETAKEIANQTLSNVRIIGEKLLQEANSTYTYWVVIEISNDDIFKAALSKISKEDKVLIDYEQKKFREEFDKEMMKLENQ